MKELWEEVRIVLDTVMEMMVDFYDLMAKWIREAISDIAFFMLVVYLPIFIGSCIWVLYIMW